MVTPASFTATGGLPDLNVAEYTRKARFTLFSLNTAGSSPTYAAKLQASAPAALGFNYITAGSTDNILKAGASTTVKLDAAFTQSGAASLKTVTVMLKKIGTIAASQTVTVGIYTDSTGAPSATLLGSATIDIDSQVGTSYAPVTATLSTPVDVADATVYHIVLSASYTASASNAVEWRSNTVASGGNQSTYNGSAWSAVSTQSFEVYAWQYAFSDVTGGAFSGLTTGGSIQTIELNIDDYPAVFRIYGTIGGTSSPAYDLGASFSGQKVQDQ
jgi:hypothetical protein